MTDQTSGRPYWPTSVAILVVLIIAITGIRWSMAHPFAVHWDEASYLNEVHLDLWRLQAWELLRLGGRLLLKTWGRPPANRMLALPLLALFGYHTTLARLTSLACFCLSACFIYLAARQIKSSAAGALAVLVFALSPEVVSASVWFSTEGPLYLATSAMLYFLFAIWSAPSKGSRYWIGLGVALGLGFLAKTSFLLIALPVITLWVVLSLWAPLNIPTPWSQWKSGVLAFVVAGPWWILNFKSAMAYAQFARGFVRNSLGPPSVLTRVQWMNTVIQCLLGVGLSVFIVLVLLSFFSESILKKNVALAPLQWAALSAAACAGLPLVLAQVVGTNQLLRHITPSVIPLALIIGVLADETRWIRIPGRIAIGSALLSVQLGMLLAPVIVPNDAPVALGFPNGALPWRTLVRFDQWDWSSLRDISDRCDLKSPRIAFLGYGREFNPQAITAAWMAQNRYVEPATWLWKYEDGPLDWQKVMSDADRSDIVMTALDFSGEALFKEDIDNEHDAEFAALLSNDPNFQKPIHLRMGIFRPVDIEVFLNQKSCCASGVVP